MGSVLPDQIGFLDAGLGTGIMKAGNESNPGFREVEIIGAMEYQALAGFIHKQVVKPLVVSRVRKEPGCAAHHPGLSTLR
jgi:hypothetical protein